MIKEIIRQMFFIQTGDMQKSFLYDTFFESGR